MAYLKFYEEEKQRWGHLDVSISRAQANFILEKLTKHFATRRVTLAFRCRRQGNGRYYPNRNHISVAPGGNLRILCHEYAHHLDNVIRGYTAHDSHMASIVDEVCEYVVSQLDQWDTEAGISSVYGFVNVIDFIREFKAVGRIMERFDK